MAATSVDADQMESNIITSYELANQALVDSGIDATLNVVHMAQVSYSDGLTSWKPWVSAGCRFSLLYDMQNAAGSVRPLWFHSCFRPSAQTSVYLQHFLVFEV